MLIGYARVSKSDGSQALDLQIDALCAADVVGDQIYTDQASGKNDQRPGLEACLKAIREGDTLVVWKLDRLGRSLVNLVEIVTELSERGAHFKVLTGQGAEIDTRTAAGRLVFQIFAAFAEYERSLISERTKAGLAAARARGRKGGRRPKMTPAKIRTAQAAVTDPSCNMSELAQSLGVSRSTLYRHVNIDEKRCE